MAKHGISIWGYSPLDIANSLTEAHRDSLGELIDEIVKTNGGLRFSVTPRYRFDERWNDFKKCMLLDGFRIDQSEIFRVEPVIESAEPVEDDLINELVKARVDFGDVTRLIKLSSATFSNSPPDYNACLTHSRIALETIVRGIAADYGLKTEDEKKMWGRSLAHLRKEDFIDPKEESAIASTYTFISDGLHTPIGFTEEEFARFGRNLAMSVCYFTIKKFNG